MGLKTNTHSVYSRGFLHRCSSLVEIICDFILTFLRNARSVYKTNKRKNCPPKSSHFTIHRTVGLRQQVQHNHHTKKLNPVALVRKRTIPTERPPPVGEVSANFCGYRGVTWSAQRIPTAVNLCFLDRSRYFLFK